MKRSKLRRIAIRLRSNAVTPLALHVNGLGETKSTGFKSRTHAVGLRLSSNELSTLKKFRKRALAATSKKIHDRTHGHTDRLCLDSGATRDILGGADDKEIQNKKECEVVEVETAGSEVAEIRVTGDREHVRGLKSKNGPNLQGSLEDPGAVEGM